MVHILFLVCSIISKIPCLQQCKILNTRNFYMFLRLELMSLNNKNNRKKLSHLGVVGDFSFVPNSHFDKYISPITNNIAYTSILAFAQTEYIISGLLYCRLSLNIKKKPNYWTMTHTQTLWLNISIFPLPR